MRIERKDDRRSAEFASLETQSLHKPSMSAVHTVKIADRHGPVAEVVGQVVDGAKKSHGYATA
jgi:hypothetical protein